MLSTNEGFGRTTIEYMRAGLAVIASNSGANPELITDNETGILYPTGDITALSDVMERIISDSDTRKRIADSGRDFSLSHFLSEDNTKAIYETYIS